MSDLEVLQVEQEDAGQIGLLFVASFADKTWGPWGPGGYYVWKLYPNMDTESGRANVVDRFGKLIRSTRLRDPSLFLKVREKSTGAIAGFLILDDVEGPSREGVAATMPDRAYFDSEEDYRLTMTLREDRNTVCEKAVLRLPDKPLINIKLLAVDPKFQSRGIGSTLMRQALRRADDRRVSMFVHASEVPAAIRTYQKHGFEVVEDECIPLSAPGRTDKGIKTRIPVLLRGPTSA